MEGSEGMKWGAEKGGKRQGVGERLRGHLDALPRPQKRGITRILRGV